MWNHGRLQAEICRQFNKTPQEADHLIEQHSHLLRTHWFRGALISQMVSKLPILSEAPINA